MRKFTVKDFITYNNPCFSCNNKINFYVGVRKIGEIGYSIAPSATTSLRAVITKELTELDLRTNYANQLSLQIYHKSNKIKTNNLETFKDFISNYEMFLQSRCTGCYTSIESNILVVDLKKELVLPTTIRSENLQVVDNKNLYSVYSFFEDDKSQLIIDKLDRKYTAAPSKLSLPLMPLYLFKDKEHFVSKIKKYLLFS